MRFAQPVVLSAGAAANVPAKYFKGLSIRETSGAAAVCRVWGGAAGTGTLLGTYALTANGDRTVYLADDGVAVTEPTITVEKVSGAYEGTLYIG